MGETVTGMAALFTDLTTVLTNVWNVITTSVTNIVSTPALLLFVILVPVISLGIGIFGRLLRIGRY